MKKLIALVAVAMTLTACENLQTATLNTNHSNTEYSKESGLNANVGTNNAAIHYQRNSSAAL